MYGILCRNFTIEMNHPCSTNHTFFVSGYGPYIYIYLIPSQWDSPWTASASWTNAAQFTERGRFEKRIVVIYGGFLKWWYPTTMGFPTKNDHFGVFWGYHHLRKHPYLYIYIYISRWWFQIFFVFTPIWERFPFWLIWFKKVETTKKICFDLLMIPRFLSRLMSCTK